MKQTEMKQKYGVNYREWLDLRGRVSFNQNFLCYGCNEPLSLRRDGRHMHHLDGNPKNTIESNMAVVCKLDHWFLEGFYLKDYRVAKKDKLMSLGKWLKLNHKHLKEAKEILIHTAEPKHFEPITITCKGLTASSHERSD